MSLEEIAKYMRKIVYCAYDATLVGSAPKCTIDYSDAMRNPKVGDMVIEISTMHRSRGTTDIDAVGFLLEISREKVVFDSDPNFVWDEAIEGCEHPTEQVYYIRTLDGRRFRWVNATFVAAVIVPPRDAQG